LPGKARRSALRAQDRPAILRMIESSSDRQYEAISCVLLEALGATKVNLTPRGGDGGIDAYGLIERSYSSHLLGSTHHPIRVVVQSKKYKTAMSVDKMKEFLQTLTELKNGGQHPSSETVPNWFIAARGPIISLAICHSGFQSGADTRARTHGIIAADSVDVAEVIALRGTLYGRKRNEKVAACIERMSQLLAVPQT
jgi:hypothetical protein